MWVFLADLDGVVALAAGSFGEVGRKNWKKVFLVVDIANEGVILTFLSRSLDAARWVLFYK